MHSIFKLRRGLLGGSLFIFISICFSTANTFADNRKVEGKIAEAFIFAQQKTVNSVKNISSRDAFFSATLLPHKQVLLAGTRGILFLMLEGDHLAEIDINTKRNLYAAVKTRADKVLIGGDGGLLYLTDSSLKKFKPVQLEQREDIFGLMETVDNQLFALGGYGLFMKSSPPYEKWYEVNIRWERYLEKAWQELGETLPHLYSSCASKTGAQYVVGEYGLLLKYENDTWVKLHGGSIEPALYGCAISEDGKEIVAVGQRGLVIHSDDGGMKWGHIELGNKIDLYSIKQVGDMRIVVADQRQLFFSKTWDDWSCKRLSNDNSIGWYVDVLDAGDQLILVGNKGKFSSFSTDSLPNVLKADVDVGGLKSCE